MHRVEITVEDGEVGLTLIHPESGCETAYQCGLCGHTLGEPGGCYDCKDQTGPAECWLTGWFDNCTPDELLHGRVSVTVPVTAEWKDDSCAVHIVGGVS